MAAHPGEWQAASPVLRAEEHGTVPEQAGYVESFSPAMEEQQTPDHVTSVVVLCSPPPSVDARPATAPPPLQVASPMMCQQAAGGEEPPTPPTPLTPLPPPPPTPQLPTVESPVPMPSSTSSSAAMMSSLLPMQLVHAEGTLQQVAELPTSIAAPESMLYQPPLSHPDNLPPPSQVPVVVGESSSILTMHGTLPVSTEASLACYRYSPHTMPQQ